MNRQLIQQVHSLPTAVLGAALPQLRPLERDDLQEVRTTFTRWLQGNRVQFASWQQAWNDWTGATPGRAGCVSFNRVRCPNCHGRRYDARHGTMCRTCLTSRRWRQVTTVALHQKAPDGATASEAASTAAATSRGLERALPVAGQRIKITGVLPEDPDPLPVGAEGTVTQVTELGGAIPGLKAQICIDWDNGQTLFLIDTDPYTIL